MFDPLTHINLNLLYVKGRTDLVLKLEFIKKPIGFLLLFVSIPFGVLWMCAGRSLYSFIAYVFNCYYTNKMIHYGFFSQTRVLLPILFRSVLFYSALFYSTLLYSIPFCSVLLCFIFQSFVIYFLKFIHAIKCYCIRPGVFRNSICTQESSTRISHPNCDKSFSAAPSVSCSFQSSMNT